MRTLRSQNALGVAFVRSALVFSLAAAMVSMLALSACDIGVSGDGGGDDDDDDTVNPPPPPPPPPPGAGKYVAGSLTPVFKLLPVNDENRFAIPFGQANEERLTDAQFVNAGGGFPNLAQKMQEIAQQIQAESGDSPQLLNLQNELAVDGNRLLQIPARGNPTDVAFFIDPATNLRTVFLPLPGGISTPNNEVAVVDDTGDVTRLKVGLRPLQVAVHPLGLVFVCEQFSNYIHVIDPIAIDLVRDQNGDPVRIPTDFFCSDVLVTAKAPAIVADEDFFLYVSNDYRGVLLKYELRIERDPVTNLVIGLTRVNAAPTGQEGKADAEIAGVGKYPQRLKLEEQQKAIYVTTRRGGEAALVDIQTNQVKGYTAVGGPSMDIEEMEGEVFVATTTPHRGLANDERVQEDFEATRLTATGIDGATHRIHAGSLHDKTNSYNFEDARNGIQQVDTNLVERNPFNMIYYTDNVSAEANFDVAQKVITASIPTALARLDDQLFMAGWGNNQVQVLNFQSGQFNLEDDGNPFLTDAAPSAIAIDAVRGELLVANEFGDTLQTFDLVTRNQVERIDLGYAGLNAGFEFPATDLEKGKALYLNTTWSNNGRKSCATCHTDNLIADGFGFSNGASAPTTYHQVQSTWNLSNTHNYFWQGSGFNNNSYLTLAFAAQTRDNCQLIEFGFIDGLTSDPAGRLGDPLVSARIGGNDAACIPDADGDGDGLPDNFAQITAEVANQKAVVEGLILQDTADILGVGCERIECSRFIDWWAASELRLLPNPNAYLDLRDELSPEESAKIARGKQIFETDADCDKCHQPDNSAAPFTDGAYHGPGALWPRNFVQKYTNDVRVNFAGTAQMVIAGLGSDRTVLADDGINTYQNIDDFGPFAFDADTPLLFDDPTPLPVDNQGEENRRLGIAKIFNFDDPERGYMPGNFIGQHRTNTPSLRGVWWHAALLHHGLARSVREAVLGPGHAGLREGLFLNGSHPDDLDEGGETGWAFNGAGSLEAHGTTQNLSPADVDALEAYVRTIE